MNIEDYFSKDTTLEFIKKHQGFLVIVDHEEEDQQSLVFPDHTAHIVGVPWEVMRKGGYCGVDRRCDSRIRGLRDRLQKGANKWDSDVEGACAEIACSRFTGLKWECAVNKFKRGGDVGNWTQVRYSPNNNSDLIIRPRDPERKPWVLVTGGDGWYLIHGWFWGYDARVEKYEGFKESKTPAWCVPQADLHPMDALPSEPKDEVGVEVTEDDLS